MKHRSVGIFVVLIATLAVAPQALQQLLSAKTSLDDSLRIGIWRAILEMNEAEGTSEMARLSNSQFLPSDSKTAGTETATVRSAGKIVQCNNATVNRERSFPTQSVAAQTASLFDAQVAANNLIPTVAASESHTSAPVAPRHPMGRIPEPPAAGEIAMIIPPEQSLPPTSHFAQAQVERALMREVIESDAKLGEQQRDATYIKANFAGREMRFRVSGEGVRRQLDSLIRKADRLEGTGREIQHRVIKVKRQGETVGSTSGGSGLKTKKQCLLSMIACLNEIAPPVPATE
ncbi:MAG: hypothetical protein WCD76_17225 [Pyrinomonadaceae bacterium]